MRLILLVHKYMPDIKWMRNLMKWGKLKKIDRYALSAKDVALGEKSEAEKRRIVRKYRSKWSADCAEALKDAYDNMKNFAERFNPEDKEKILEDILFCRFAYGFSAGEYFAFHLMEKTASERRSYISDRYRKKISYYLNDIIEMDIFLNKFRTYEVYKDAFKRDAICIKSRDNKDEYLEYVKRHPVFVKKNVSLSRGRGVELVNLNNDTRTAEDLFNHILDCGTCILEEQIEQGDELAVIHPSSINTVRCVTVRVNGKIHIPYCILRMGHGGSFVDNASAGGVVAVIDPKTGKICSDGMDEKNQLYPEHPDSHILLKGFQIPDWNELLDFVNDIASRREKINYVGWDLAYSKKGWVIVEGNCTAQLEARQILSGGMKKEFDNIMNRNLDKN